MRLAELKTKNTVELERLLQENREHLLALRFKIKTSNYKKVKDVSKAKKMVARILTLLSKAKKQDNK